MMKTFGKFCSVRLKGGRFEVVPRDIVILNAGQEGHRSHLWAVWAMDCAAPCDMTGAAEGRCAGPLMGFLSDWSDLDPRKPESAPETASLIDGALRELSRTGALRTGDYSLAWARFDMAHAGETTQMYLGHIVERSCRK